MQAFCKCTNGAAEAKCSICGQGFEILWERQSRQERAAAMREIQKRLLSHHRTNPSPQAHPRGGFMVAEPNRPLVFSGVPMLGQVPSWAL